MSARVLLVFLALAAAGCSNQAGPAAAVRSPQAVADARMESLDSGKAATSASNHHGFASLPDHGDFVAYPGKVVRHKGAYTWYRTDVSEAHALHAIAQGDLRVTTPAGKILDFRYDRHIEHPSGDWTWVGHLAGDEGQQTILTFGDHAAYGSIAQPDALPLRLTVRDGASWLVQADPSKLASINDVRRPDYHIVPPSALSQRNVGPHPAADGARGAAGAQGASAVATTTPGTPVVDLLVGYTSGFAAAQGGASATLTRINYLVDVTNIAYANSQINARVQLVKAMQVNYTDGNSNNTALKELTGYDVDAQQPVPPAAAFNALRAARETYGADLVSLVRDFKTPENEGCGIAWLVGGGLGGTSAIQGSGEFGYSVVSDGVDTDEGDNKNYYCLDETLAHELGHNMGAAHDKETSKGDDGVLDNPDDYGAFTYSFGYKATPTTGDFYTIMAYGDTGQHIYRTFSNPVTTFCGGAACGTATQDNARTLNQTIPVVAGFRQPVLVLRKAVADFNGDGASDLLWRHGGSGANTIWLSASSSNRQLMASVGNAAWEMVGIGDFNGDGQADVLWRNSISGADTIWRSGNAATVQQVSGVAKLSWKVVGVGDFNGDGVDDILWRNSATGANTIWKSANSANQQRMTTITDLNWTVVGVGDFNNDGKFDILWRHAKTGASVIWRSGDYATRQSVSSVANLDWQVRGVGDFDGDAVDDILWRNISTGAGTIWLSANASTQDRLTTVANLAWRMESVGDFDGDGHADIMWRNANSGANVLWPSGDYAQQQILRAVADLNWQVQPRTN